MTDLKVEGRLKTVGAWMCDVWEYESFVKDSHRALNTPQ